VLVFGMVVWNLYLFLFHGVQASTKHSLRNAIPEFNPLLIATILHGFISVKTADELS